MFWMMLGVVGGFGLGGYVLLRIYQARPDLASHPTLALFVSLPILGGGLVGGGYLAQWLVYKYERRQRDKRKADKEEAKSMAPGNLRKKKKKK